VCGKFTARVLSGRRKGVCVTNYKTMSYEERPEPAHLLPYHAVSRWGGYVWTKGMCCI
jgi:hypothetical protein